ncbi:MAG: hypothetical protein ACO2PN_08500 [Pyrobaculum sp.]
MTPSLFYAVVPPLFSLAPISALLALYIAAVTLSYRSSPPVAGRRLVSPTSWRLFTSAHGDAWSMPC